MAINNCGEIVPNSLFWVSPMMRETTLSRNYTFGRNLLSAETPETKLISNLTETKLPKRNLFKNWTETKLPKRNLFEN